MRAISIVIPILNEKKNLEKLSSLITKNLNSNKFEIIFVDDNSNDGSDQLLKKLSKRNKKIRYIIRKSEEKDLSKSCIEGFRKSTYQNILVMDGDLQHDPKDIKKIAKTFFKEKADVVVGSRDLFNKKNEGLDLLRLITSKFLIIIVSLLLGKKTSDPMSGFFLFKKKIFTKSEKKMNKIGYKILLDLIYSVNYKIKVVDVVINFKTRQLGNSKMNFKILIFLIYVIFLKFFKRRITQ
tara:strand:+ start:22032 stop:22745 length:714 start_codon:yes stop_codon:yes gene_type:complete